MPHHRATRDALRGVLVAVYVLGALGTLGELLLVGHVEDRWQLVPVALLGGGLLILVGYAVTWARGALVAFRGMMILHVLSGGIGLYQHYHANVEFKVETYPELAGFALFWEAIQGSTPPTLAPGAMVLLALAGLGYLLHHPALARPATRTDSEEPAS